MRGRGRGKGDPQQTQASTGGDEPHGGGPTVPLAKRPKRSSLGGRNGVGLQLVSLDFVGTTNFLSPTAMQVMSSLSGSIRDDKEREWRFPVSQHDAVVKKLTAQGENVTPVPKEVFATIARSKEDPVTDISKIPEYIMSTLMPFQLKGLLCVMYNTVTNGFTVGHSFGITHGGKCLIGDEMGLGKTIQAIAIASYFREEWPLLIICPSSLRLNWASEITKFIPDIDPFEVKAIMKGKDAPDTLVNIISYDLVSKMDFKKFTFKVIIADESHYLKNPTALRSQVTIPLLKAAHRAILLSGTPALSRPIELFPQLQALGCPIFKTQNAFGARYCSAHMVCARIEAISSHCCVRSTILTVSSVHIVILAQKTVMIRRLKADVLRELPPKLRQQVVITPAEKDLVEIKEKLKCMDAISNALTHCQGNLASLNSQKRAMMTDIYQETARAKLPAVKQYIKEMLEGDYKFLLFAHHQVMLDGLEEALCALLGITAAGTGLTLSKAQVVVFAELYWNPGSLMQAEDRAHRIGQTNSVLVQYLLCHSTLDDFIWPLVEKKLEVLGKVVDGAERSLDATKASTGDVSQQLAALEESDGKPPVQTGDKKRQLPISMFSVRKPDETTNTEVKKPKHHGTLDSFFKPAPSSASKSCNTRSPDIEGSLKTNTSTDDLDVNFDIDPADLDSISFPASSSDTSPTKTNSTSPVILAYNSDDEETTKRYMKDFQDTDDTSFDLPDSPHLNDTVYVADSSYPTYLLPDNSLDEVHLGHTDSPQNDIISSPSTYSHTEVSTPQARLELDSPRMRVKPPMWQDKISKTVEKTPKQQLSTPTMPTYTTTSSVRAKSSESSSKPPSKEKLCFSQALGGIKTVLSQYTCSPPRNSQENEEEPTTYREANEQYSENNQEAESGCAYDCQATEDENTEGDDDQVTANQDTTNTSVSCLWHESTNTGQMAAQPNKQEVQETSTSPTTNYSQPEHTQVVPTQPTTATLATTNTKTDLPSSTKATPTHTGIITTPSTTPSPLPKQQCDGGQAGEEPDIFSWFDDDDAGCFTVSSTKFAPQDTNFDNDLPTFTLDHS
ncbi:chromatin remodeling factor18 [Pelomyxa schiedti]|nr:chromatin remodeling factor18 [Pelomyxa schiedti]KAH3761402.1 chromatin remodeling factor18 [Pelomyxa schiedti]